MLDVQKSLQEKLAEAEAETQARVGKTSKSKWMMSRSRLQIKFVEVKGNVGGTFPLNSFPLVSFPAVSIADVAKAAVATKAAATAIDETTRRQALPWVRSQRLQPNLVIPLINDDSLIYETAN